MIKVSIITVSYNSEKTIAKTIEAVLNQTYENIEYIIIDGKSEDNTVAIAQSYEQQFKEKGYEYIIISEPDKGMYDALNKGARMATGELVGQTNADDWYETDAVSEMVRFYQKEHYDIAWADLNILKASGNMIKHAKVGKLWTTSGFCHPTMFSKREILLEIPYSLIAMDDDFDFILKANNAKKKIMARSGKPLANYTFGGMSTEKSWKKARQRMKMKYATYCRNHYSKLYWFYCVAIESVKYILG